MENKCRKTDLELMKIVDDLYTELPSLSAITLIHLIENVGYELEHRTEELLDFPFRLIVKQWKQRIDLIEARIPHANRVT